MKIKLSSLRVHIIIFLALWSLMGIYAALLDFHIPTPELYFSLVVLWLLSLFIIYKKYNPVLTMVKYCKSYIVCGDKCIGQDELLKAFEVSPVEKIFFALKSPELDFSSSLLKKGLVLKTAHESCLVDNYEADFIERKKVRRTTIKLFTLAAFYLLMLFPAGALFFLPYINADVMFYSALALLLLIIIILRLLPPFYMGQRIDPMSLPLEDEELKEFRGIKIIEGFALSDMLAPIPFKKQNRLDGLAVNTYFKKYIVLNPRLFSFNCEEYLRFVLFHELCHIKHRDGSDIFAAAGLLGLIEYAPYFLPSNMSDFILVRIRYYDYIIAGIATLYFGISVFRRKRIETRADRYAADRIGEYAINRIYEKLGFDLSRRI